MSNTFRRRRGPRRTTSDECRIDISDLRPQRRKPTHPSKQSVEWVGPRTKNSVQPRKPQEVDELTIKKRTTELQSCLHFLQTNFLQQVQRHFDTVLVESADLAYRRTKLGRPTKCMSQKESVQQTIDKMQEHLTKMKSLNVTCPDFDTKIKRFGQVFMELHSTATAGCMTLHATFKKKNSSRVKLRRSESARNAAQQPKRPASASAQPSRVRPVRSSSQRSLMHPRHDVAVSNYMGHGAQTEFTQPKRFSMDMDVELTDLDFDTELSSADIGAMQMDTMADMTMRTDEDMDFMTDQLFEKLSSIV